MRSWRLRRREDRKVFCRPWQHSAQEARHSNTSWRQVRIEVSRLWYRCESTMRSSSESQGVQPL
jgi:hypothetical protein